MISKKNVTTFTTILTLAALSTPAAFAATTPYDLIRPTWPLNWDAKVFEKFDTTITKKMGVLNIPATPENFKAGKLMPDTLDQAYFDAINTKISPIRVNQAGYLKSDKERQFYFVGSNATEFEVVDEDGKSLSTKVTGTLTTSNVSTASDWTIIAGTNAATTDPFRYKVEITGPSGKIFVGNIPQSVPTDKRLRIKVGNEISSTFIVSDNVYSMAKDATLKFFGIQRSGNSESWFHGPSHVKDGAGKVVVHEKDADEGYTSKEGALQGGWYDSGDHLKESQTQAFAFMALAVMSATNPSKDVDHYAYNQAEFVKTDGVPDILREAKHGADFFLRAYDFAKGVIDDMPVSVGNFSKDHSWWGRPEIQDYVTVTGRGGPAERDVRLGELGANISAEIAAGLAILSKDYTNFNKPFADSCLIVAEKLYDFAKALAQGKNTYDNGKTIKNNKATFNTYAYNGNNEFEDDLALASVALLYATGKKEYADDMIRTKDLYASQKIGDGAGFFAGGWFATPNKAFEKSAKNTSWANSYAYATYALYKLILADKEKAISEFGLTEEERLAAIEDCLTSMIINLSDLSTAGTSSIVLPTNDVGWKKNTVNFDPTWYTMLTDQNWIFNGYQTGNTFEVLAYADVAADIEKQGIKLPTMESTGLKAEEMRQLGINQLNYLFGMNPWDISFVYGVGDKNDAHPFHKAANPEGKNMPGLNYKYAVPVGALVGWQSPNDKNSMNPEGLSWEKYFVSEVTLNASSVLLSALTLVSNGGNDYYEKKCENCKTGEPAPFADNTPLVTAYRYEISGMDFFGLQFHNETLENLDSVVAYVYFEASQEDVESCGVIFDHDICIAYDIAGFSKVCDNDRELRNFLRSNRPQKIEDSYNKDQNTYTWQQPIYVGNLDLGSSMRLDIGVSSGIKDGTTCETLRQPAKIKVTDGWSFTTHAASDDSPAYKGTPTQKKDYGDTQQPPQDPYIVLRSKDKLLWGYGPAKTTSDRVGFVKVANVGKARMLLSDNRLFVLATAQGTKTIKLFDLLGNQLMEHTFDGLRTEVNLAKLPHRGTLIAKVMQNNKQLAIQRFKVK